MRSALKAVTMLAVASVATACSTDLTGINVNPNAPTSAPAGSLFTSATVNTVGRFYGGGQLSLGGVFAQHLAQVQYVDEDRGRIRTTTIDAMFAGAYTTELMDFKKVINLGVDAASPNTSAPAAIMTAWTYQNMTDLWGDIPYSEALQGDVGGPIKPKYDAQKDIYKGLLKSLTDATASIKLTGDAGIGTSDPIFKGDMAKWQRFGNSLRLRLAMRESKADQATADLELKAALAAPGGVMAANSDNAALPWPGDGIFDNGWAATFSTRDDHRMAKTLMDPLIALNDPRLAIFAQPTKADATKYAGLQNGMNNVTVTPFFNTTSRPGTIFYPGSTTYGTFGTAAGKKTPTYLMTFAEVSFIKAEAAARSIGGLTGAAAYYNAGVRASILQWGGTDAQADTYLAQPAVAYQGGAAGLAQIGLQKWIALFTQGDEGWAEWRRTGFPATIAPGPSYYFASYVRRLPYSSNEQSVNAASLAEAIARQGADDYLTRMWWDK